MDQNTAAVTEMSTEPNTSCSSALDVSLDLKDASCITDKSEDLQASDCSKMDIDSSSSSIVLDKDCSSNNEAPTKKKIKLSTDHKLLKAEREQLKKEKELLRVEREKARLEKAKEKIEKEKEKIEKEKLKLKQKEEREAEREKKQQEFQMKKIQLEKEKIEKLRLKEEERERKEREKKEKEDERNKIKENKELEKRRRNEEKQAIEERKKQQDELEEKKLQKSRNVLFNFLKKSQSDSNVNSSFSAQNNDEDNKSVTPQSLLDSFNAMAFKEKILKQSEPLESLYLNELISGKIKPYSNPQASSHDDGEIIDLPENYKQEKYIFLQFYENTRPAYFGKRLNAAAKLTGRNPFIKEDFLDYEVDSDEEWDEGGPGESLSDSDKDHEEKDDYEIDDKFFVPHGYLSDDENKTSETTDLDANEKSTGPLLKEQALMAERNRKFANHLSPQIIGCVWQEDKQSLNEKFNFLQQFKAVLLAKPVVSVH